MYLRSQVFPLALLIALPCLAATPVHATNPPSTGTIMGTVRNDQWSRVAYIQVKIAGARRAMTTDETGSYTFSRLPPALYLLQVQASNHVVWQRLVRVDAGQTTVADVGPMRSMPRDPPPGPGIGLIVDLMETPGRRNATAVRDSLALYGVWRWNDSFGGLLAACEFPSPSGWVRRLYIGKDGRYAYWEFDSVSQYLLYSGNIVVHRTDSFSGRGGATLWVEFPGWGRSERNSLLTFYGTDRMSMYPGSNNTVVSDALTKSFERNLDPPEEPAPSAGRGDPPPRIIHSLMSSYSVRLPNSFQELRNDLGPLHEWMDWQYPPSVRERYAYRDDQIPSALLGDFDGDGAVDVVIHGNTDVNESRVICFLSNRGSPTCVQLLAEPTILDRPRTPRDGFREPHPTLFLMRLPAGERRDGLSGDNPTDAVLVARPDGHATVYCLTDGEFQSGQSVVVPPWDPRETAWDR